MRLSRGLKIIVAVFALCAVSAFLIWAFLQGRKEQAVEQERERPIKAPSRVSIVHGKTAITLDAVTQKMSGIVTTALVPGFYVGHGGKHTPGVVVPDSAVVWLDGKAWAYVQKGREPFFRQEVSTNHPVGEGWLVTKHFSAGDRVVVQGAQLLLSEEFRSQIRISD
ncbi:MAG: hypothetical protein ACM3MD_09810 [Betaproteobacteria bacterium]